MVHGVEENRKLGLIVRFAKDAEMWRFSESVPGLRWTYWDPTGQVEAIPMKNKIYHQPLGWLSLGIAFSALLGAFLWITFNPLFTGILGILLLPFVSLPLHLVSVPFSRRRQRQSKGLVLVEAGKVVLTTGNVVWLNPVLSNRRTRNPRKLLVKTGKNTLQLEFEDDNHVMNGLRLLQQDIQRQQTTFDQAQIA